MRILQLILVSCLVCLSMSLKAQRPLFVEGENLLDLNDGAVLLFDMDGDKDLDIVFAGNLYFRLYKNEGDGTFSLFQDFMKKLSNTSLDFADTDQDGDLDFLVTGYLTDYYGRWEYISEVYINNGPNEKFTLLSRWEFEGVRNGAGKFGDFNGDDYPDVILVGDDENNGVEDPTVFYYLNDGSGEFDKVRNHSLTPITYGTVDCADVDLDGDQDVFISGHGAGHLFLNDGSGQFSLAFDNPPFDQFYRTSHVFGDVDNDGDEDLLLCGRDQRLVSDENFGNRYTKLYLNDGNGFFRELEETPFEGVALGAVAMFDVDNDGDLEVLVTGRNNEKERVTKFYTNVGDGKFREERYIGLTPVTLGAIAYGDIDKDADRDLILCGRAEEGYIAKIYRNVTSIPSSSAENQVDPLRISLFQNTILVDLETDHSFLQVSLYDVQGKQVQTNEFRNTRQFELETDLEKGAYLMIVETNESKRFVRKFVLTE